MKYRAPELIIRANMQSLNNEKDHKKCNSEEDEKASKKRLNINQLIDGLTNLKFDGDLVSKSPMRTHEVHHCSKPYGYPQGSSSRTAGGITRVVEEGCYPNHNHQQRLPIGPHKWNDVNIDEVGDWMNNCNRNPKMLQAFVEDCQKELEKGGIQHDLRSFTTMQQYKMDRLSICSNSSSQISSPAQSPSERNLTSPESVGYEDNSLYHPISPNIPSFDSINIKSAEETDEIERLLGRSREDTGGTDAGVAGKKDRKSPEIASPNIGTVMLRLETDSYENTIDLNKFTSGWDADCDYAYSAVEKEELSKRLDPKSKENAWTTISQMSIDALAKGDRDGDTQFIILIVAPEFTLEFLYTIVERFLKENPEYLASRNKLNQDALYLAALQRAREPMVASYIAEALIRGKQDVNRKYSKGNSLLHLLSEKGDAYAKVLERLLRLRKPDNTPAFDVNSKNNNGFTPLHVACKAHRVDTVRTYQIVRLLVENGAVCSEKEYIDENTPLHVLVTESCDTELLRILLDTAAKVQNDGSQLANRVPNRQGNTALHLACKRNTLGIEQQKEAVEILLRHGAMIQLKNINGCVPSVLVDSSRKQEIKSILHSHRQK